MISRKTAQKVFERDQNACILCGLTTLLVVHHRMNRGMGGSKKCERLSNYLTICSPCNSSMESDASLARKALRCGIKVSRYCEPDLLPTIPVTDFMKRKWLLDDDYGRREVKP